MKNYRLVHDLIKNREFTKKIRLYFATRTAGDDYDPYEKNYEYTSNFLNPYSINAIVTQVTPTQLVYKQYGLSEQGAVEVITAKKYKSWFQKARKIEIDDIEYEVFSDATGGRAAITDRANNTIKLILTRK